MTGTVNGINVARADASPSNPEGITGQLCTWIRETDLAAVPEEIITRAKYLILDGLACGLVAAHLPWSEVAVKGVCNMESTGPCTVIGWGDKNMPPLAAALLNSTFIQGFELDDYHSAAPIHINAIVLPALFAAIETKSTQQQKTFSGIDLLKSYIVGCEVGPQ